LQHTDLLCDRGYSIGVSLYSIRELVEYFEEYILSEKCVIIIGITTERMAMECENALVTIKRIRADVKFIFCIACLARLDRLFLLKPVYMLPVPVRVNALLYALEECERIFEREAGKFIVLRSKGRVSCLEINEIVYIESNGRCIEIHMNSEQDILSYYMQLGEIINMLPVEFIRCHQSYCINCNYVQEYNNGNLLLRNGKAISVSKRYRKEMRILFEDDSKIDILRVNSYRYVAKVSTK